MVTLPKATPTVSGISYRDVWKFRVVNAALVPNDYKVIDEVKISGVVRATKGTLQIPGIKMSQREGRQRERKVAMSSPTTLFTGAIDARGRLSLDRPVDYGRQLMALAG